MELTITKCNYTNKDKEGNPLIGKKSGKPYFKVGILTNEFGSVWLNGFTESAPIGWEGTTRELEVVDDEKWGKQFKEPKGSYQKAAPGNQPAPDALRMERKLDAILTEIQTIKPVLGDILQKLEQEDALAGEFN